ncbi:hypothetical protein NM688_g6635 [Phlebia brevispora]|uniref:Uncharacterized protein n=1 Tax=Phlebia brevispora TaxID=194682 RepID=A0ACC1SE85_9APHY|nr:hypothetical protein NM688_g6635 [Phlebia brevispora]
MPATDSIAMFAEGTFEEQIKELLDYLSRGQSEEEKAAFLQPFVDAFATPEGQKPLEEDEAKRKQLITLVLKEVKGLGDGKIEGFFNLLFAHFLSLFPLDAAETRGHIVSLLQIITVSDRQSTVKYRILANLFNSLPRRSGLRLTVNKTLIELASANDELEHLDYSGSEVDRWISEWDVSAEEKSAYLKTLSDAFAKSGASNASYNYELLYVKSLPSTSASAPTLDLIATALRLPNVFDFDTLFRIDAITSVKDTDLFALLQIYLNDGLSEYKAWEQKHGDAFAKYNLDKAQLERKIRLLSLTTLAFQNIGRDLTYSVIADLLQVEVSQVERWVIDGIHSRRPGDRKALPDIANVPYHPRKGARIRARTVGGTREASECMEDWTSERP